MIQCLNSILKEVMNMDKDKSIKLFEQKNIRTHWDEEQEKWFFSIIDIVEVLTGTDRPRKYWSDLKAKLISEGSQLSEKIGQLKMKAEDGKMRLTDVADTEEILRLIQSIPSPKAEPFKMWLAKVGSERIDETADPELTIERALETYLKKGYSQDWINQRLKTIEVRKALTDECGNCQVRCRPKYKFPHNFFCFFTSAFEGGFSQTTSGSLKLRMPFVQRSGCFALAAS